MQTQKEQIDSTSNFMKGGFVYDVLTKDVDALGSRLERTTGSALSRSKRKKHKKKRTKARG